MEEFERFIEKFKNKSGIDLNFYKRKQMERRIRSFARSNGQVDLDQFFDIINSHNEIYKKFVNHLTINVSEFFRNPAQWDTLIKKVIPELIQKNKNLKIWSAGCSTGEEPYTLAIILERDFPTLKYSIHASDLDDEVLKKAEIGLYGDKAIVNVNKSDLQKYFTKQGNFFSVNSSLKKNIKFSKQNLLKDSFDKNFDLILCRNVVIYFTEESKFELYKRFYQSLRPGGVFFTGNTEQIFNSRDIGFQSIAAFFYQKPY
ncbi:chemotaxis protein methyltransferase CheR [Desulfitispora alkaliphila]|uniref:CheR family methyltransferase n=1 Tax=Desulfitispora alkaliphila TaxID=622674 RepID=UPI003D1DB3F3